ncbi:hypothetical protein [Sulfurirhabdus autotrophica]|uniref:Uncharacterized protein n=1 Tax=Sulfurirhabdus autotrophica TaxID=1706046 RepID=A0A4R3YAU0_9PROT|nr:hypothetical protein [Sulfurirhabdus autotrophica]TCV89066.1 hypothetical protein EDC63_103138 [Sulfurirhabdus autotrophica]
MQIITANEALKLSEHAQIWIEAHMMWFMKHVMDVVAHEASVGKRAARFENIRIGSDFEISAWKDEMTRLGYSVTLLGEGKLGTDSFEVSW